MEWKILFWWPPSNQSLEAIKWLGLLISWMAVKGWHQLHFSHCCVHFWKEWVSFLESTEKTGLKRCFSHGWKTYFWFGIFFWFLAKKIVSLAKKFVPGLKNCSPVKELFYASGSKLLLFLIIVGFAPDTRRNYLIWQKNLKRYSRPIK